MQYVSEMPLRDVYRINDDIVSIIMGTRAHEHDVPVPVVLCIPGFVYSRSAPSTKQSFLLCNNWDVRRSHFFYDPNLRYQFGSQVDHYIQQATLIGKETRDNSYVLPK